VFSLSESTGQLSVDLERLDFESNPSHTLNMKVVDRGGFSHTAQWIVRVNDIQEKPTILTTTLSGLQENSPAGAAVGAILATDPDAADVGQLSFSIVSGSQEVNGDGVEPFVIEPNTGVLRVRTPRPDLNFERKASYKLSVEVRDTAGNTDTKAVTVNLEEVNEEPSLGGRPAVFYARAASSGVVGNLIPLIADEDVADSFEFEIVSGNTDSTFSIGRTTGVIAVANNNTQAFSYVEGGANLFNMSVRITDRRGLSTDNNVVLIYLSKSNNYPWLRKVTAPFVVEENAAMGTWVKSSGTDDLIVASDRLSSDDLGQRQLFFDIVPRGKSINQPFPFTIEAQAPQWSAVDRVVTVAAKLVVNGPVDYEGLFASYEATVVVTDADTDFPLTTEMSISVLVTDVNESPSFLMPMNPSDPTDTLSEYTVFIEENAATRTTLTGDRIIPLDADIWDQWNTVRDESTLRVRWHSSTPQTLADMFELVDATAAGEPFDLQFRGRPEDLDFEDASRNSFLLTLEVEDSLRLTATVPLRVVVTDVNEPPSFTSTTFFSFSVDENAMVGTVIGEASATDPDTPGLARSTLRYELVDESTGFFEIDSRGRLRVAALGLDWEDQPKYVFTVRVTDGDASDPLSSTILTIVDLNDLNDITIDGFFIEHPYLVGGNAYNIAPASAVAAAAAATANSGGFNASAPTM